MNIQNNILENRDCILAMQEVYEKYGEYIDLLVTDPPYGKDYQSNGSMKKKNKIFNDKVIDYKTFGELTYKLLKPNSHAYIFTSFDTYPEHYKQLTEIGFNIKNLIIAEKMQVGGLGDLQASFSNNVELIIFAQKGRRKFNETQLIRNEKPVGKKLNRYNNLSKEWKTRFPVLWKVYDGYPPAVENSSKTKDNPHPTPKNPLFLEWLIRLSSKENDIILDPFMGSGSTAIATINASENRKFIGYEIESSYYNYAKNRINQYVIDNKLQDKCNVIA